jgi:hypothetical protein
MLTAAIVLSLVFVALGFIVTPGNAKYLLSGYNLMSEADRAKIDIVSYVKFFNRFHLWLGISLCAGFFALNFINSNWAAVFLVLYPLLAYIYMVAKGNRYYRGTSGQRVATYVIMAILLVIAIAIGGLFFVSMRNSQLFLTDKTLDIKGIYGIKVAREDIYDFRLVRDLPDIARKSNGFAAGEFSKGTFITEDGLPVKLFVNKKSHPFLVIRTKKDEIYFSSDEVSSAELYNQIKVWKSR